MRVLVPALALVSVLLVTPSGWTEEPVTQGGGPDELGAANRAASMLLAERLRRDRPDDWELLRRYRHRDVLVVRGEYDRVDQVLRQVGVPFDECAPEEVDDVPLHGVEAVLVNCPGRVGREGAERLRRFVERGGFLFTTDWAVLNVLEPAFPGTVRFTRNPTRDDVVPIRVVRPEHLFLRHVLTGNDDHRWWLESASYPVEVLDPRRVEVLIESREMRERYGSGPIAVTFRAGRGRVVHVVSHFYLQRSELRHPRDRFRALAFAEDLGFAPASPVARRLGEEGLGDVPAGELRTAYSAQQFLANLLVAAKRSGAVEPEPVPPPEPDPRPVPPPLPRVEGAGAVAATDAALRDAPDGTPFRAVSEGLRLRVLGRRGGWVEVATPSGTTGWLAAEAVRTP